MRFPPRSRIYPNNFEDFLNNYIIQDQTRIKNRYNQIYDRFINSTEERVELEFDNHKIAYDSHNKLLSSIISAFQQNNENIGYNLLFVDPLYYAKRKNLINANTPTFDILFAEVNDDNEIISLLFIEAKSRKPQSSFTINDLHNYENDDEIRNCLFNYISNYASGFSISENVTFEYVLAVQERYSNNSINSIKDKNLPFILWSIIMDIQTNEFNIKVHEKIIDNLPNEFKNQHDSRVLYNFIIQNTFTLKPLLEFTLALDTTFIILTIYYEYKNTFGNEISFSNFEKMVIDIGFGGFIDDEDIINDKFNLMLEKGIEISVIKKERAKYFWKEVNYEEKIKIYRFNKKMREKAPNFLTEAINEVNPTEKQRNLNDFFRN